MAAYEGTKDTHIFNPANRSWFRAHRHAAGALVPDGHDAAGRPHPRRCRATTSRSTRRASRCRSRTARRRCPRSTTSTPTAGRRCPARSAACRSTRSCSCCPTGACSTPGRISTTRTLNVTTGQWTNVGASPIDGHSAVMYRPGKILKSGTWADPDFPNRLVTNRAADDRHDRGQPDLARGGADAQPALVPHAHLAARRHGAGHRRRHLDRRHHPVARRALGRALGSGHRHLERDGLAASGRASTTRPRCCSRTGACCWRAAAPSARR